MSEISGNKFLFVSPPRSQGWAVSTPEGTTYGVGVGLVAVLPVSLTPQALNLQLLFAPPTNAADDWSQPNTVGQAKGFTDSYVTFYADQTDVGIILGATQSMVSGAYSPQLSAFGAVSAGGVYTANGGECYRIPSALNGAFNPVRFLLQPQVDVWLGFVGSGNGLLRIYQSSPPNA